MDDSPLGKLAPEIRNTIYEHVLIHDEHIWVNMMHDSAGRPTRMRLINQKFNRRPTALLAVCRQTMEECTEMFYTNNRFRLGPTNIDNGTGNDITALGYFMSAIGVSNQFHLRHVAVAVIGTPRKYQLSIDIGSVKHGLFKQLRHIERHALRNPHIQVECLIGLKCYKELPAVTALLKDMRSWYASKYTAKKALGTFKQSDPDGKRSSRSLRVDRTKEAHCENVSKILDSYISAEDPCPYDSDSD
ncbi:hypothetical protein CKM354_000693000 [Cercospora kikuchii]|uniref:Uncharacterized protein n=1 Tax=Cercospora kikuchii TaxID=84275 RepID=A0A9P3FDV9_9PEZI|nr:uncharacterized protein CKM354_000693000 [Cercospora kikuchii]GIZ43713.1 hypothetical protein CKM354_000693000 [Cercospora kikuchii]